MNKEKLDNYLRNLERSTYKQFTFRCRNETDLKNWQTAFRAELKSAIGLREIEKRAVADLNPRMTDEQQFDSYTRQEWLITTEAGFNLMRYLQNSAE